MLLMRFQEETLDALHRQEEKPPIIAVEDEIPGLIASLQPQRDQGKSRIGQIDGCKALVYLTFQHPEIA